MITCPDCGETLPNGTIICPDDGADLELGVLVPPEVLPHRLMRRPPSPEQTFEIIIEDFDLPLGARPSFSFLLSEVGEPPLRIGRQDLSSSPPINPEVDLAPWLGDDSNPTLISRIQCVIERRGDQLVLRTMSDRVPTYHRRTGESRARPLSMDEYVDLEDYDMIYLNHPHRHHVRLRIRILHL